MKKTKIANTQTRFREHSPIIPILNSVCTYFTCPKFSTCIYDTDQNVRYISPLTGLLKGKQATFDFDLPLSLFEAPLGHWWLCSKSWRFDNQKTIPVTSSVEFFWCVSLTSSSSSTLCRLPLVITAIDSGAHCSLTEHIHSSTHCLREHLQNSWKSDK